MQTLKDSIKTIAISVITLSLISIAYAWTEPTSNPPSDNVSAPITTGASQIKSGGLGVASLDVAGGAIFGSNLSVAGDITSGEQSVITSLSAGSGISISGSGNSRTITSTGASESDPTVEASVKDGITWSEIASRPAGLDDGDQDTKCNSSGQCSQICIGSTCKSSWPVISATLSYNNCEWIDGGVAARPKWSTAYCPSGKNVSGSYFLKSNNTEENTEYEITPTYVRARRPNDGSNMQAKAYCCNIVVPIY